MINDRQNSKAAKEDIKNLFFLLFIVSVATFLIFIYLWRNIQMANLDMEIEHLKKEKKKLLFEIEAIHASIASTTTPERIEKLLKEHEIYLPVRTGKSIISVKLPPMNETMQGKK
ncbi:MAG: hypothetical protein OEV66_00665 [Spirochaetia bacterium]|nr:hypothetical protein [Spirochaetia bacterium]